MTEFTQQIVNGLTLGAVYALVALGYTMIFGVLELIAFAQGGVYMVGAYAGLLVAQGAGSGWPVGLIAGLAGGALAAAALNLAIDRVAYRPLRTAGRLAPLISGIGVYIFLENGMGLLVGRRPDAYPAVLPAGLIDLGLFRVTLAQVVVVLTALLVMVILWYLVTRTGVGLTMRAVAERPATASLMGIEPERVIMLTFVLGGALAGVAGVLVGAYVGLVAPTAGFGIGVKAFAAAVIGGIGNIPGALLGGLTVGLLETFATGYISSAWGEAIVFVALILALVVRPQGLLGTKLPDRA